MEKTSKIRVLIVDDHPVVRMGLRLIEELSPTIKVVGQAASGAEALREAAKLHPDVVLLDYRLPDLSGHDVCKQLKAAHPELQVLFLTSYAVEESTRAALEAGADGYLLKENDAQKIVDAIHAIRQGGMVIDPAIARAAITGWAADKGPTANPMDSLSEQERRVLAELATGKPDKEIAEALQLQAKTVRNYLAQVYRKLGVRSRTEAALLYQKSVQKSEPA